MRLVLTEKRSGGGKEELFKESRLRAVLGLKIQGEEKTRNQSEEMRAVEENNGLPFAT